MSNELKGLSLRERIASPSEVIRTALDQFARKMRVACPAIIQSFDAATQTVAVQIALLEEWSINGVRSSVKIPIIEDVPIVIPRAGDYSITFPVSAGDECLLVFGDMCIDSWWQNGGDNNVQMDRRRHDLSDPFAILGCWSQKRLIPNYSTDSVQVRNEAGTDYIEIKDNVINIITTNKINITASSEINIDAAAINLGV